MGNPDSAQKTEPDLGLPDSAATVRYFYLLKRWPSFARFLEDGRIFMTNNAAERAVRGIALGRKSWLFGVPTAARNERP